MIHFRHSERLLGNYIKEPLWQRMTKLDWGYCSNYDSKSGIREQTFIRERSNFTILFEFVTHLPNGKKRHKFTRITRRSEWN